MDTEQYQFYKNAQYRNTRNEKKTLIVDIDDSDGSQHLSAGTEFNIDLYDFHILLSLNLIRSDIVSIISLSPAKSI